MYRALTALLLSLLGHAAWAQSPVMKVLTFQASTVAALRAYAPTTMPGAAHVSGYTTDGDGGGGAYRWDGTSTVADDGCGVIKATAVTTGRWIAVVQGGVLDIRRCGAKPDNATDIAPAIQAAYNDNLGCIYIPAGTWLWSTAVTMGVQPPCVRGSGWNEAVYSGGAPAKLGTWIHFAVTTFTPVTITGITGQGGPHGFEDMAFYADQPTVQAGYTPSAYPYIFSVVNNLGRVDFRDLMFYNVTHCINLTASARAHIERISGQPQGTCLYFDNQYDVFTVRDVEFWPFWSPDTNVMAYQEANVDPIVYNRADTPYADNVFVFGYHSGLAIAQGANGTTTGANFGSLQVDASKYGLWVKPGTSNVQFQAAFVRSSGQQFPASNAMAGSETYRDEGTATVASISNLDCYYEGSSCIDVTGSGGILQTNNVLAWSFNHDNNGSGAFRATSGNYIFSSGQPSISNPANGGGVVATGATGIYGLRGVRLPWTPTIAGSTTAGTPTYQTQLGSYWYDGSQVTVQFSVSATAISGAAGNWRIGGLPYPIGAATGADGYCTIASWAGFVLAGSYSVISALISAPSSQVISLLQSGGAANSTPVPTTAVPGGMAVTGICTYAYGQ